MKKLALSLIKLYQRTISRVTFSSCRFTPSCSHYTYEAIDKYGIIKGIYFGLWRIIRCNPWNKGGFDPIP